MSAQGFELKKEQSLAIELRCALVDSLGLQHPKRRSKVKPTAVLFGLPDKKGLIGCEVMTQSPHPLRDCARVLQFAIKKVDGKWEFCGC
jgi:hypothetical protein